MRKSSAALESHLKYIARNIYLLVELFSVSLNHPTIKGCIYILRVGVRMGTALSLFLQNMFPPHLVSALIASCFFEGR